MKSFHPQVIQIIKLIPWGKVASYGQISALAGNSKAARQVAWVLHSSSEKEGLPWHRVISSRGRISLKRGCGFEEQKKRLEAEGVKVGGLGRINLSIYGWEPASSQYPAGPVSRRSFRSLERRFRLIFDS